MLKFLLLAFALWLVIRIVKSYQSSMSQKQSADENADSASKQPQNMVQCAHCGVHLPQDESYLSKQQYYCSQAHMDLHNTKKTD